jgi:uncharacterized small protein (DUF1192 family)
MQDVAVGVPGGQVLIDSDGDLGERRSGANGVEDRTAVCQIVRGHCRLRGVRAEAGGVRRVDHEAVEDRRAVENDRVTLLQKTIGRPEAEGVPRVGESRPAAEACE